MISFFNTSDAESEVEHLAEQVHQLADLLPVPGKLDSRTAGVTNVELLYVSIKCLQASSYFVADRHFMTGRQIQCLSCWYYNNIGWV